MNPEPVEYIQLNFTGFLSIKAFNTFVGFTVSKMSL